MSSRQEEKERRRQERLAREQAEQRAAARKRRLQLVGGGVLGAATVAAVVVGIASGGGGGSSSNGEPSGGAGAAKAPTQNVRDFNQAVEAAGCVAKTHKSEGREHLSSESDTFDGYKTNPPTSGTHGPAAAEDGIYEPGSEPSKESLVHSLEHGRILVQYKPGTPQRRIAQLEGLVSEPLKGVEGYHQTLLQNNTNMDAAVAATGWTQSLTCKTLDDKSFDAIRAFRERFVDKAPELIP